MAADPVCRDAVTSAGGPRHPGPVGNPSNLPIRVDRAQRGDRYGGWEKLSARECLDANVASTLENALAERNIDGALPMTEITDSFAMNTTRRTIELIRKLNQLGIDMELNDLGTGYSSLSLLRRFRIPQLKIDRFLVDAIAADGHDAAIVRGTLAWPTRRE